MEKTFECMREYVLTHFEINKEVLKKVKKESVSSTYYQYEGELSLALCLQLITREEFNDFESKLLRVYSVRNCIPEEEIKDTIGAGDSYIAGFLYEYAKGSDLKECIKKASEAALPVLKHHGAFVQ
jgi:bifunctional ADP-heptose synthase (sugar kinase/adenylyltransferase)